MVLEQKLYTPVLVGQIIKEAIHELVENLGDYENAAVTQNETVMKKWASDLMPSVEAAVSEEVVRRHVQGVTFAVWAGPVGSGKGTNIDAVSMLGSLYAEVVSQGGAAVLPEPYHSKLLQFSIAQSMISTGTRGMFNRPAGEYVEMFSELQSVFSRQVADGGFVPNEVVSVLVELMILYRLTQNSHKIQIDLWPRTVAQFADFKKLVSAIRLVGGKVTQEVVNIRVLNNEDFAQVKVNPKECSEMSKQVGAKIYEVLQSDWYKEAITTGDAIEDPMQKFTEEEKALTKLFEILSAAFPSAMGKVVIDELLSVCGRMAFRFKTGLAKGDAIRPDAYPLSVMRRLYVYTSETSPAFLDAYIENGQSEGFYLMSSFATPQEVVADLLETLVGSIR